MNIRNYLLQQGIRKKDLIGVGIFLSSIAIIMIFTGRNNQKKNALLEKSFRYTICVTTGKVKNLRSSGPDLQYKFKVGDNIYTGSRRFSDDGKINYDGGQYIVKFQPEDPTNNEIQLEYPVPASISDIPDSGWKEVPKLTETR